jgi:hypothetical protein
MRYDWENILKIVIKFLVCFLIAAGVPVFAQNHTAVPLENQIYIILDQAQARGLCSPLSGVRPYTRSVVISAINEILETENAENLRNNEVEILKQYLDKYSKPKEGIDFKRGGYYTESSLGKNDTVVSMNAGATVDMEASGSAYLSGKSYWGTEVWVQAFFNGDLGNNFSYEFNAAGGLVKAPRYWLGGDYNTYYKGFTDEFTSEKEPVKEFENQEINTYSEPLTHFPYTYKKRWDGSVFFFDDLSHFDSWPNSIGGAYSLTGETTASFLENKLILRMGRISHDWGSAPIGSSLALNQMARPFAAVEGEFTPFSWFSIASMTGILEYYNIDGIKESSASFQNAYSVTMMQFRYKNYLYFDLIDAVIWPKRFELGYVFPIINSFFYQNNIGDFDNMALAVNIKAQYPGMGSFWFSAFLDEVSLISDFNLDRQMFAWQAGVNIPVPILSFSSVKFSYTVISPYCYTHNRNFNPWFGDLRMETAYTNNGVGLGYYLPPNSDEILVRFNTMPSKNIITSFQYQLIRHGADHGESAVDGSNLQSELDPDGRNTKAQLKKYFLQDGAYQWSHVIRLGGEWTLSKTPLAFFGEAGVVISYFTNIEGEANNGAAQPYSVIDTDEYPKSTGFIAKIGVKIFPK